FEIQNGALVRRKEEIESMKYNGHNGEQVSGLLDDREMTGSPQGVDEGDAVNHYTLAAIAAVRVGASKEKLELMLAAYLKFLAGVKRCMAPPLSPAFPAQREDVALTRTIST